MYIFYMEINIFFLSYISLVQLIMCVLLESIFLTHIKSDVFLLLFAFSLFKFIQVRYWK